MFFLLRTSFTVCHTIRDSLSSTKCLFFIDLTLNVFLWFLLVWVISFSLCLRKFLHVDICVVYYMYTYANHKQVKTGQMQIQPTGDSVVQVRTVLITSDFGSSARGERHNSYCANHTIWPKNARRILRFLSVEIKKKTNYMFNGQNPILNFQLNGRNSGFCMHSPMSTFN